MRLIASLAIVLSTASFLVSGASQSIEVTSASRKYDASNAKVTLHEELELTNTGSKAESSVIVCKRAPASGQVAFYRIVEGAYKRTAKNLDTVKASIPTPAGIECFSAQLSEPLAPQSSTKVTVYSALVRALSAFPENVTQADVPKVILQGDATLTTPYRVVKQTTTVKTASNEIHSFGQDDKGLSASKSGSTVTYGPFENIEGFVTNVFKIHCDFPKPIPRVLKLTREVTVSPWGNIYVEEDYDVTNDIARLVGPFSRLRHMVANSRMGGMGSGEAAKASIETLTAKLPKEAKWAYFKDDIGNISTSNTRVRTSEVEITLSPRFPLYGGWRSVFKFGYALPFKGFLTRTPQGVQRLRVQFGCPIVEALVDEYELRVVLPEGSKPLLRSVQGVYDAEVSIDSKTTYLDLKARPVVVLRRGPTVYDHNLPFTLDYEYPGFRMMQGPATLGAAALVVALTVFLLSKVSSLSISQGDERFKARVRQEQVEATRVEFVEALQSGLRALDAVEADLRTLGDKASAALPTVRSHRLAQDRSRAALEASLKDVVSRAGAVDASLRDDLDRLSRQLKSLLSSATEVVRSLCEEGRSDFTRVGKALMEGEKGRKALLADAESVLGEAMG